MFCLCLRAECPDLSSLPPNSGAKRPHEEEEGGQEAGGDGDLRPVGRHRADDRRGPPGPPGNLSLPRSAGKIHHGTSATRMLKDTQADILSY